jgi:hypothetical protein
MPHKLRSPLPPVQKLTNNGFSWKPEWDGLGAMEIKTWVGGWVGGWVATGWPFWFNTLRACQMRVPMHASLGPLFLPMQPSEDICN